MSALDATSLTTPTWGARAAHRACGALLVVIAIAGVAFNTQITVWEAQINQGLLSLLDIVKDPQQVGSAVIFADGLRYIGLQITPGCSVAMLLAPFVAVTGVLLWVGRGTPRALGFSLGLLFVVFMLTNQLRLSFIAGAMHWWGFERGYEISHVAVGSIISAFGFVFGIVVFVIVLTGDGPSGRRGAHHA